MPNVERCVAECTMPPRIVLTPLFERGGDDVVSALTTESIRGDVPRQKAIDAVMTTLAQAVVSAHVASSDVQVLADRTTGEVLIVDWDQAKTWAGREFTSRDALLVNAFAQEVLSLFDDPLDVAKAKLSLSAALATMASPGPEAVVLIDLLRQGN